MKINNNIVYIDSEKLHYKDLNNIVKSEKNKEKTFYIYNVCGQRYIGTDVNKEMLIQVEGTAGNDLGAFMDGPVIEVFGNAQDGVGNTMNRGRIIVHGHAGDIVGHSMRGGEIYIRDDVGYRCGIHMKEYMNNYPVIVVGGTAQDYLGEYMAGGVLLVLGLTLKDNLTHKARLIGTGMHGGVIYLRGKPRNLGNEVEVAPMTEMDRIKVNNLVNSFSKYQGLDVNIPDSEFTKLVPSSKRPYGTLYVS